MPNYQRPGVYFEERVTQAEAITGSSLSAGAFLAGNPRGPVNPVHITSWTQYLSHFGGFYGITDYLPYAVYQFFANGGRDAWVARVAGSGAAQATKDLRDRGTPINEVQTVTISGGPTGGTFTLTYDGQTTTALAYNAAAAAVQSALEALSNIAPGEVAVTGGPGPATPWVVAFAGAKGGIDQAAMTADGALLTGGTTPAVAVGTTTQGGPSPFTLRVTAENAGDWANQIYIDIADAGPDAFHMVVKHGGSTDQYIVERWLDLSMDPTSGRYIEALVNAANTGSAYIRVEDLASPSIAPANRPSIQAGTALAGGTNGAAVQASDILASVFDEVGDRPLTLNLPGHSGAGVGNALSWAASRGDVFVVIDPPMDNTPEQAEDFIGGLTASSYGALYYPWINIADPASSSPGAVKRVPPGGAVIGQFASTDATRGVFKTPAGINTRINGAVGIERRPSGSELDALNQAHVNVIRHLPGAGVVIMGGRTLKMSGSDKYVAVRRTLIYIRSSLVNSTRFAIFEPNDDRLWLTLRTVIERFLLDLWQRGGLRGVTAAEAFFVKCDDELNTAQSVAAGEVKVQIGVALQYPAEYVVFTLSQREVGATVTVEL